MSKISPSSGKKSESVGQKKPVDWRKKILNIHLGFSSVTNKIISPNPETLSGTSSENKNIKPKTTN